MQFFQDLDESAKQMKHPQRDGPRPGGIGFTRIELLLSLTIVSLLFVLGVLVARRAEVATQEARAIAQARGILSALRAFANDHDQHFPDVAHDESHAILRQGVDRNSRPVILGNDTATDNFSALIGGGYYNEERFYHLSDECYATARPCPPPDRDTATPILPENIAWAYVRGLQTTTEGAPLIPVVMTRNKKSGVGLRWPGERGRVGGGLKNKIVVGFAAGSARLITLSRNGIARDELGRDITSPTPETPTLDGHKVKILQP